MTLLLNKPIAAADYNTLPYITDAAGAWEEFSEELAKLEEIFRRHAATEHFSLHLVHKHFDIEEDNIMISYQVDVGEGEVGEVCRPRPSLPGGELQGHLYLVTPEGRLQAYEYTTNDSQGVEGFDDFLDEFVGFMQASPAGRAFSLELSNDRTGTLVREFELPEHRSTGLLPVRFFEDDAPPTVITNRVFRGGLTTHARHCLYSELTKKHKVYWTKCDRQAVQPAALQRILEVF